MSRKQSSEAHAFRLLSHAERAIGTAVTSLVAFAHKSQRRYLDEFLSIHCGSDLMTRKLFPNSKEITESFGAFNAVRKFLHSYSLDEGVTLLAVGDGHSPRTGATFAMRTGWNCYSVDPDAKEGVDWNVERLTVLRAKIEDVKIPGKRVVIVAVHSHATLRASIDACTEAEDIAVVAIPCCVRLELPEPPDHEAPDFAISSPERTIKVWHRNVAHLRTVRS